MALRKLLIVTYHFPPSAASGSFRMLGLARHLPRFDWQVVVVAAPPMPWEPEDRNLLQQVPPQTPVHRAPYFQNRAFKLLRRLAPYSVWLPGAFATCVRAVRRHHPDVVLTSGPPHWVHLLGYLLKRCFRIPWVADFRDPWIAAERPKVHRLWWIRWQAFWEKIVMKHSDVIVANAPRAGQVLQSSYPLQRKKIVAITNGYDPESFNLQPRHQRANGFLSLVHAGELYAGRDPRPLLNVVQEIKLRHTGEVGPLRISFLGQVNKKAFEAGFDFQSEINQRGLEDMVEICGQISYHRTLQEMMQADILVLLDSPGRRVGVPAKLYEYIGTGHSILALAEPDGDVAWVLRQSGVSFRIASPLDSVQIKAALLDLVNEVPKDSTPPSRPSPSWRFSRQYVAQQVAQVMNRRVLHSRGRQDPSSERVRVPSRYGDDDEFGD